MRDVRSYHDRNTHDDEIVRDSRKKKTQSAEKAAQHITEPFSTDILKMKYRKATTEIRNKADYASYEDKLTDNEKNICNDIFTYTAKILTNISVNFTHSPRAHVFSPALSWMIRFKESSV